MLRDEMREALLRAEMPQVSKAELPELCNKLKEAGIKYKFGKISCESLKPLQDGINRDKVERIKEAISGDEKQGPIIVSNDGYIIDGHHRWVAFTELYGSDTKIEAIMLPLKKEQAHQLLIKTSITEAAKVMTKIWVAYEAIGGMQKPTIKQVFQNQPEAVAFAKKNNLKIDEFVIGLDHT